MKGLVRFAEKSARSICSEETIGVDGSRRYRQEVRAESPNSGGTAELFALSQLAQGYFDEMGDYYVAICC